MTSRPSRLTGHVNQSIGSYELVLSAVVFGLLGWWIDRRLGTTPAFMIGLTVLGFVGSALSIYYRYRAHITGLGAEPTVVGETRR